MKSLRNKFAIAALVAGSFVGVANAGQVVVSEAPINNFGQEVSADFAANRQLGRAWIDVSLTTFSSGDGPPTVEVTPKAVDGLYYDSARKQVLYRTANETIVCAEDATVLGRTYLKGTGRCLLTPRIEHRKVDDGFNIHERTVAKVVFDAPTSAY